LVGDFAPVENLRGYVFAARLVTTLSRIWQIMFWNVGGRQSRGEGMADIDTSVKREADPVVDWILNLQKEHPWVAKVLEAAAPAAAGQMVMNIPGTHMEVPPAPYPKN
jgi:hypothetical protein